MCIRIFIDGLALKLSRAFHMRRFPLFVATVKLPFLGFQKPLQGSGCGVCRTQ